MEIHRRKFSMFYQTHEISKLFKNNKFAFSHVSQLENNYS